MEVQEERWDMCFTASMKGIFSLTRKLGPGMVERQYGKIGNDSPVEHAGATGHADYAAAKARGVTSLTCSLAGELALHVNVYWVAPGIIRTLALRDVGQAVADHFAQKNLLKRRGGPEDIANTALVLAGDESRYIAGVTIPVSGGLWSGL